MAVMACDICATFRKYGVKPPETGMCDLLNSLDIRFAEDGELGKISYQDPQQGKRFKIKIGKFIKKYFPDGLSDHTIQKMVADLTDILWKGFDQAKELSGEDIRDFYLEDNSGIHSCMSDEEAQSFLNIYVDNPEVITLATVRMGGNAARALVWNINGQKYMDRIYHTADCCMVALQSYAARNNILPRDKMRNLEVELKIRNGEGGRWPYADTMMWVTILSKNRCRISTNDGDCCLDSTDGYLCGRICDCCGEHFNGTSYHAGNDTICEYCFENEYMTCEHCEDVFHESDTRTLSDNTVVCSHCFEYHCFTCESCGEDFDEKEQHDTDDGTVCNSCSEEYGECEDCGVVIRLTDLEDGLCGDCFTKREEENNSEEE